MSYSPTAIVTTNHNVRADTGFFGVYATGLVSFSHREKVRMREPRGNNPYLSSPHPSPLPEG